MIHVTSDSLEVQYPLERPWNSREKTNRNKAAVCSSPTLLQVYPGRTRHVVLSHPSVSTLPMSHSSKKLSRTSAKNHENLRAPNDTPPPIGGVPLHSHGKIGRIHPRKHAVTCWIITKLVVWVLDVVPFPRWHVQEGMGEWWWNKSRISLSVKKQVPLIWNNWQHPLFYWNLVLKRKQP